MQPRAASVYHRTISSAWTALHLPTGQHLDQRRIARLRFL